MLTRISASRVPLALASCSLIVSAWSAPALAAAPPDEACRAAKLKAAGKYASAVLGCNAKAAKDGSAADPACLAKAEKSLDDAFAKAESKTAVDCNGTDVISRTDVEDMATALRSVAPVPSGGGACASAVHKAAGKFAASYLGAWSKFLTKGDATKRDESIAKARTKLTGSVLKAETKTGCAGNEQGGNVLVVLEDGLAPLLACMAASDPCVEAAGEVPAGGSVSTDSEGTGADVEIPVTAEVETPNAGIVLVRVLEPGEEVPNGYGVLGRQVDITAPEATAADPLVLTFVVDSSLVPADPGTVGIARNGTPMPDCSGAPGTASPDPCIASRTVLGDGDLEIVCRTSQASLWTPVVELPVTCDRMLWQMNADEAGDDRATEIDLGWSGNGHNVDMTSGMPIAFAIDCAASEPPCGTCTITGFDPSRDGCRCANDWRQTCDSPRQADADDCGGADCQCFTRGPIPASNSGTSVCLVGVATNDASGTWDTDAGSGSITLSERLRIFLGGALLAPCPTCDGDTPGDGIRAGLCNGGRSNGLPCDATASDPTFPYPAGGHYSLDCMPNAGSDLTGPGIEVTHTETTASVSLPSSVPCTDGSGSMCPCAGGPGPVPVSKDDCSMDDCTAGADGEAVCAGDTEKRCDGIVDEQGDGLFPCSTDSQCAAIGAGACTIAVNKPCFAAPITATGVSDPTEPRTVAAVCVPASGNTALDANYGLLGPVRLRTDWTVTMIP